MIYQWLILQEGSLPLKADGRRTAEEHVCTSVLLWPAGSAPTSHNSLLVDPCFSRSGMKLAQQRLAERGLDFGCVGHYFQTHQHYDHVLSLPEVTPLSGQRRPSPAERHGWKRFSQIESGLLPGIDCIHCPGHEADLQAIRCQTESGETWVVGDAILDSDWLTAWMFYWPNGYVAEEIIETWRSVGTILASADVVIPGHGAPWVVDDGLLATLLDRFPQAAHSRECPEVVEVLERRLQTMREAASSGSDKK